MPASEYANVTIDRVCGWQSDELNCLPKLCTAAARPGINVQTPG